MSESINQSKDVAPVMGRSTGVNKLKLTAALATAFSFGVQALSATESARADTPAPHTMGADEEEFVCEGEGQIVKRPVECPVGTTPKKRPIPKPQLKAETTGETHRKTPNLDEGTYYFELNDAGVNSEAIDQVVFNDNADKATFTVRGERDVCFQILPIVEVVKPKGAKEFVQYSNSTQVVSLSIGVDGHDPTSQTIRPDELQKQPVVQSSVALDLDADKKPKLDSSGRETGKAFVSPLTVVPQDGIHVDAPFNRRIEVTPQKLAGGTPAFPVQVKMIDCNGRPLYHVQPPSAPAAIHEQMNVNFQRTGDFTIHGQLRPVRHSPSEATDGGTHDKTKFPSGWRLEMQPRRGVVEIPAGMFADVRRVGHSMVNDSGRPVPDNYVRVTLQSGRQNHVPEGLIVMNGEGADRPEIKQLADINPFMWGFETDMIDPNQFTANGSTFRFKRGFYSADTSTGEYMDIAATVMMDKKMNRTFNSADMKVQTDTPIVSAVEIDYSQYNVDPFTACSGVGNALVCVVKTQAGDQTQYKVCGAGVNPADAGKKRYYHLLCGSDMVNEVRHNTNN